MTRGKELYKTLTFRPFQYNCQSIRSCIIEILILLIPQVAMLFLTKSFDAVFVLTSAIAASVASEFTAFKIRKTSSSLNFLASVLQGALIGLLLPEKYSLIGVFLIVFMTLLILRYSYGNFSDNWINPVALTIAVAYILGQSKFPTFMVTAESLMNKNPSLALILDGSFPINKIDLQITGFLNSTIFKLLKISIPEGYVSLLWDTHSSIPAFRFNFITIVSSIVLFSTGTISCLIPGIFITVYSICALVLVPLFAGGPVFHGDIILALSTSGILFSTLFVLQWYGTTPISTLGKIFYAVFAGIACFLINGAGTSPIGSAFTILTANVFSTFIQYFEEIGSSKRLRKILVPKITAFKEEK